MGVWRASAGRATRREEGGGLCPRCPAPLAPPAAPATPELHALHALHAAPELHGLHAAPELHALPDVATLPTPAVGPKTNPTDPR